MALSIKSDRGHDLLIHRGFIFMLDKKISMKKYWRSNSCTARCMTSGKSIVKINLEHNHTPDPANIEKHKILTSMKERAISTQESTQQILATASIGISNAASGQLPSVPSMKKTIRRTRHGIQAPAPNPLNLTELTIPHDYSITLNGTPFLLHDSGNTLDRILIFSTNRNLDLMSQCSHWFADGTFKASPPLFPQVYTIHAVKYSNVIPTVVVLMPNKSEATYTRVLNALKNLNGNLNPTSIMTDFEQAAIKAFRKAFPGST